MFYLTVAALFVVVLMVAPHPIIMSEKGFYSCVSTAEPPRVDGLVFSVLKG